MKPFCGLFQCSFNLPCPCEQLTFATIIPCIRTSTSYISHRGFWFFFFNWCLFVLFDLFFVVIVFGYGFVLVFLWCSFLEPVCCCLQMYLSHLTIWKQRLLFL